MFSIIQLLALGEVTFDSVTKTVVHVTTLSHIHATIVTMENQ